MSEGACRDVDNNLFFPESGGREAAEPAIAICAQCDVRLQCRTYAIEHNIFTGIWGGTTGRQRRDMADARKRGLQFVE